MKKLVQSTIDTEEYKILKKMAHTEGISIAAVIRRILRNFLKK